MASMNVTRMVGSTCLYDNCNGTEEMSFGDGSRIYIEHPEEMLEPVKINPSFIPIVATHAVTFLIGVAGNIVVILTWAGKGRLRSPTAAFLVSLAVADLLLLFVYVPLETLEYFVITVDQGGSICKLSSYVEMLSGMASVLNLVAVSIERFLVIVFPMKARRLCTLSTSRKGLILVWTLALLLASPVLYTKRIYPITYYNNHTSLTAYYCWDDDDTDLGLVIAYYQLMAMFVIPALFMVICYFVVIQELWLSTKTIADLTNKNPEPGQEPDHPQGPRTPVPSDPPTAEKHSGSSATSDQGGSIRTHRGAQYQGNGMRYSVKWTPKKDLSAQNSISQETCSMVLNHSSNMGRDKCTNNGYPPSNGTSKPPQLVVSNARKQVIKMLIFVVAIFMLCWGPRLVMNVIIKKGLNSYTHFSYNARVACYLLSFIHSAANPFVYGLMSSNFRRMLCKGCSKSAAKAQLTHTHKLTNSNQYRHARSKLAEQSFAASMIDFDHNHRSCVDRRESPPTGIVTLALTDTNGRAIDLVDNDLDCELELDYEQNASTVL